MPLFEETNQPNNQNQQSTEAKQRTNQPETKSSLLTIIGQLLPLAPFAFEQFTGQKVPAMTGTIAEMQSALINIQTNLQVIANNQQDLSQRLITLEQNATNQLTNLNKQFNSLRLTHTKEQKRIEFDRPQLENAEENY